MGWEDSQFPEFYASQYGGLRRLGFLLTGDWSEGEELAQDALVRVYWRWALVCRQEHPEAYARKVLINRHRSLLRRLRLDARHGGQGNYVWEASGGRQSAPPKGYWVEIHFPKFNGMGSSLGDVPGDLTATMMCVPHRAGVLYGAGPLTVTTVRVELAGRPAVAVPTAGREKNLPFTVWVLAPLPLDVQVRAVVGLDAAGRQVGRPAKPGGVTGAVCRA